MSIKDDLKTAIEDIRFNKVGELVKKALEAGLKPLEIFDDLRESLNIVGDKYKAGEYFLSELYIAAETMKNALEIIQPLILNEIGGESEGTIVIGSIEGDIHDFGKIIVSSLLSASGFNVVDIGVDVPVEVC